MIGCYGNCAEDRHFSNMLSRYEDQCQDGQKEMEVCENCDEWFDIEESVAQDCERFCGLGCEREYKRHWD